MKILGSCVVVLALAAGATLAQQPNSNQASLTVNGFNGPPFPIMGVSLIGGNTATLQIDGTANQPFTLAHADSTDIPGLPVFGGTFDLEFASTEVVLDGFNVVPWLATLDGQGVWSNAYTVPVNIQNNLGRGYQAAVGNPSSPHGATPTAATTVTFTPGPQTTTIPSNQLGANGSVVFNLGPHGLNFPFYAQTWSSFYVNANGSVTFGGGDGDFTATSFEMHAGRPRVSCFWTDLDPGATGTVSVTVDITNPGLEQVKIDFANVRGRNFGVGLPPSHTFSTTLFPTSGDINLSYDPFNGPSFYDTVCGISPGNNISPMPGNQSQDLSVILQTGIPHLIGVNEGLFEFFVGTASITPGNNFWDLAGLPNGMTYQAVGPGTSSAQFFFF